MRNLWPSSTPGQSRKARCTKGGVGSFGRRKVSDLAANWRRGHTITLGMRTRLEVPSASMEKFKHSKIEITTFEALGARWESNTDRSFIIPQYHKLDVWA